ncbi:hypothetical protein L2E82_34820 [Cichorium intybus]|uniref:Uncharacterized protein n=1 Tax=Cichorium intybus TaxID=13427 RepID=A0ACB9BMS1_CICIN|nr:hypothetical protein L2E82_34820 [Cichorium intybus]
MNVCFRVEDGILFMFRKMVTTTLLDKRNCALSYTGLENSVSFQFCVLDCDLKHCTLLPILKMPFGWEVDILDYDWKSLTSLSL